MRIGFWLYSLHRSKYTSLPSTQIQQSQDLKPNLGCSVYLNLHIKLCDYLMSAATHAVLRPCYNLSGGRSVECQSLLNEVLQQFEIPLPDKTIRLSTAMHFASLYAYSGAE